MSLRVAFDLDGTLADMVAALRREAIALFGDEVVAPRPLDEPAATGQTPPVAGIHPNAAMDDVRLSDRQHAQLWDQVVQREDFWTTLAEVETGIVARIAAAAERRRWEVLFVTTRPASAGDTTQRQTQRWLVAHGFPLPSVYVIQHSRGRVASALALDALVDDRVDNCVDVAIESKALPLLIWHGAAADVPSDVEKLGIRVVGSIAEAVTALEKLDTSRQDRGIMRRLKRMLGQEGR